MYICIVLCCVVLLVRELIWRRGEMVGVYKGGNSGKLKRGEFVGNIYVKTHTLTLTHTRI